ncbi:hypothetical protein EDB81DRAFT_768011 [Dactylonectria macrodidyma]|uniref:DUF4139 domain-containing protein n=1 Tax=Dactylonectria macrodidyma TaxID=307937 RepID=A0A9P9D6U8_9HYPO|nr:hypothetical protein EDB81DRAFT_768011 [Dactylonectria macrodidyma]
MDIYDIKDVATTSISMFSSHTRVFRKIPVLVKPGINFISITGFSPISESHLVYTGSASQSIELNATVACYKNQQIFEEKEEESIFSNKTGVNGSPREEMEFMTREFKAMESRLELQKDQKAMWPLILKRIDLEIKAPTMVSQQNFGMSIRLDLFIEYTVTMASWNPQYELSFSTEGTYAFQISANLHNTTAETWKDCNVVLYWETSTHRPRERKSAQVENLSALFGYVGDPMRDYREELALLELQNKLQQKGGLRLLNSQSGRPKRLGLRRVTKEEIRTDPTKKLIRYSLPGPLTLSSSRLPVSRLLDYSYPNATLKEIEASFGQNQLSLELSIPSDIPFDLLEGKISVRSGGTVRAEATLPQCYPGDQIISMPMFKNQVFAGKVVKQARQEARLEAFEMMENGIAPYWA